MSRTKLAARRLAERAERRTRLDPETVLFGPQRVFVQDPSPRVLARCSRRAGKSYGVAFKLLKAANKHKGSISPYIVQSRETAKDIIWLPMQELDDRLKLGLKFRENTGEVVLPNGSKIILRGAGTKREVEKLRGPKYPLAVVDEAQGFGYLLRYLIEDVLEPATMDFGKESQICLTGTPNAACAGPYYEMDTNDKEGWSNHHWTMLDNPHIPDPQGWLERKKRTSGWNDNHPTYLREYMGIWIRDVDGLVFKLNPDLNVVPDFDPEDGWSYTLGIDLGFNDPTAFVIVANSPDTGRTVVVESYKESDMIPSAVAAEVEKLNTRYGFSRIVADTGGFGKGYAEEMKTTHGIPVVPAKKRNKATYIDMLNGDLQNGSMTITSSNTDLLDEMSLLQWDLNKMDRGKLEVDDRRFEDHLCDALLYAWRDARHMAGDEWEHNPPVPGTKEWMDRLEDRIFQNAKSRFAPSDEERHWYE